MKIFIIASLSAILMLSGCCSLRKTSCESKVVSDSLSNPVPKQPTNIAAIVRNSSNINITVDSVHIINGHDFKLYAKVVSEQNTMSENPTPDIGINIEIIPDFYQSEKDIVDYSHDRNKRIMKLKDARVGEEYSIVISRDSRGTIHLIDLIEH
ncbi:MAG: hypothetical protein C0417_06000 [Chlorobiaceae bacterium]|nr:hypothetical protein [Chlorobiaceae bacterium]